MIVIDFFIDHKNSMTSEISRQLVTLGEELKRKREICCDVSVSPVSLLCECSQVTKVPLAFKEICDFKKGLFSYEVKYGDHSATGSGSTKKESKRIAAENLVSKAIKSVSVKSDSETHVKDEISCPPLAPNLPNLVTLKN